MTLHWALAKLCRLMSPDLQQTIDPIRLARAGAELTGHFELSEMPRLQGLLYDPKGRAEYRLNFTRDEEGWFCITGVIRADLTVACQRCLGPLIIHVQTDSQLAIVRTLEQAREIPDRYDPLILGAEPIKLLRLIEDELILAIPMAPIHEAAECEVKSRPATKVGRSEKEHPFAGLSKLKDKHRSN